ncbi:hypothetical protein Hanom_Chr00s148271g01821171 [Helianthus anomalus]
MNKTILRVCLDKQFGINNCNLHINNSLLISSKGGYDYAVPNTSLNASSK